MNDQGTTIFSLAKYKFSQENNINTCTGAATVVVTSPSKMVRMKRLQRLPMGATGQEQAIVSPAKEEMSATRTVASGTGGDKKGGVVVAAAAKAPAQEVVETRKPPKKRKKSLQVSHREPAESEERDAAADDERQDVSPPTAPRQTKGAISSSSSAWETLMNVAALVPPLPTTTAASHPPLVVPYAGASPANNGSILDQPPCPDVIPNSERWEEMFGRLRYYRDKVCPV
jgi:hypothetical protein